MNCPICGTNLDNIRVDSTYQWNNGLPKSFCKKDWHYYTCNKCFYEREKLGKELLCCFVFLKSNIYIWVHSISKWQKFYLNPSRRDILGDFVNEQKKTKKNKR